MPIARLLMWCALPLSAMLAAHAWGHHAFSAEFDKDAPVDIVMRSGKDEAFITYYAVDGVRHSPPPLPGVDVLDVPYLGAIILEAAGLPLSDVCKSNSSR